jgi:hypothetical protein
MSPKFIAESLSINKKSGERKISFATKFKFTFQVNRIFRQLSQSLHATFWLYSDLSVMSMYFSTTFAIASRETAPTMRSCS